MITLASARQLKASGLPWAPRLHDFFAIPDRGMDNRVFVISDMSVDVERLKGQSIVTFNGTSEWALDYELMSETVWLPTEEQLRDQLVERLEAAPPSRLVLTRKPEGYLCEITWRDQPQAYLAPDASEAYAAALLRLLEQSQ